MQHQYLELGHFRLPVSPAAKFTRRNWQASIEQSTFARQKTFLLADVQNVLAKHEMFKKFGGGETSNQGQAVETISCQANNAGQFRQAFNSGGLLYMNVFVKPGFVNITILLWLNFSIAN